MEMVDNYDVDNYIRMYMWITVGINKMNNLYFSTKQEGYIDGVEKSYQLFEVIHIVMNRVFHNNNSSMWKTMVSVMMSKVKK